MAYTILTQLSRPSGNIIKSVIHSKDQIVYMYDYIYSDGGLRINNQYISPPWILRSGPMRGPMKVIDSSDLHIKELVLTNEYKPREVETPFGLVVIREKITYQDTSWVWGV